MMGACVFFFCAGVAAVAARPTKKNALWACRSFRRASSVSRRLEVGSIMSSRSSVESGER